MLLELSAARRLLAMCGLCLALVGLRLIPTPPPARADVCGTFPISLACGAANGIASAASTVVHVGGGAAKLGVNVTTGAISLGGKIIGKAVSVGGNILCNWVAEGWQKKLLLRTGEEPAVEGRGQGGSVGGGGGGVGRGRRCRSGSAGPGSGAGGFASVVFAYVGDRGGRGVLCG